MKEITEGTRDDVQGIDMIDLGDAVEETRQFDPVQVVQDSAVSWGRPFFDE